MGGRSGRAGRFKRLLSPVLTSRLSPLNYVRGEAGSRNSRPGSLRLGAHQRTGCHFDGASSDVRRLVLDTNLYSFGPLPDLARLAERGFLLSVSEIAFTEALAKSVREYESGGVSREQARGKFFARAKRLAPFMNPDCPVALGAGGITRRMAAMLAGRAPDPLAEQQAEVLNVMWHEAVQSEYSDDVWLEAGKIGEQWLSWRDDSVDLVVRTMRAQPIAHDWATMGDAERVTMVRASLARFWGFTSAMTERLDAHVATVASRICEGAGGTRPPRRNDGADVHLTQHLAEGFVLVTHDGPLIDLVDRAGTYQAPWVRRLNDLENLPHGLPWGETAHHEARRFTRRR